MSSPIVSAPPQVVTGRTQTSSGHPHTTNNGNSSRMRFSLSSLQSLASQGNFPLSPKEVESLKLKGVLRTNATTATNNTSSSLPPTSTASTTTARIPQPPSRYTALCEPSLSAAVTSSYSKPPLPLAARLAPMVAAPKAKQGPSSMLKQRKKSADAHLVIAHKERTLPSYHEGVIEDTCSHLQIGPDRDIAEEERAGIRRHSDASALGRMSLREDPRVFDSSRRASIATASPTVPSLLGNRHVLYKASYNLTLLSLPSKTSEGTTPSPTKTMSAFKFPADSSSSAAPFPSPSSPSSLSTSSLVSAGSGVVGPTSSLRSKRKSSIPMRSPSWNDAQDASPGVIFQLPFGTPPTSSPSFRKGSIASSPSSGSPQTPPSASCPSPQLQAQSTGASARMQTPPSPVNRSGLGIQVHATFSEPGATHPLESAPMSIPSSGSKQEKTIYSENFSAMSIGDIVIAEQVSAAQRIESGSLSRGCGQEVVGQSMPTPPLTSRISPLHVMETIAEPEEVESIPPTPFTPGPEYRSSGNVYQERQETSEPKPVDQQAAPQETTSDRDQAAQEAEGSTAQSLLMIANDAEDNAGSDTVPPLWAQRQLSIRRQSAIPRPELDFVKGSGILPPANKDLKTVGGARILSYPVLISDMVHVALDEIQAKGGAVEGSDATDESSEEMPEHQQQQQQASAATGRGAKAGRGGKTGSLKRKRTKGRNAGTKAHNQHTPEDDAQTCDEAADDREAQGRSVGLYSKRRRSSTPHDRAQHQQRPYVYHHLASPVELSLIPCVPEDESAGEEPVEIDSDADAALDIMAQEEDSELIDRRFQSRHSASSPHQTATTSRHHQVPEHLRIPPAEVELAMQLSREMMNKKRQKQQKEQDHKKKRRGIESNGQNNDGQASTSTAAAMTMSNSGHHGASFKSLKPLLDATRTMEEAQRKRFDADDEDYNGDEDTCEPTSVTHYTGAALAKHYPAYMLIDPMMSSTAEPSGTTKKAAKANGGMAGRTTSSSIGSAVGSGAGTSSGSTSGTSSKKTSKAREGKQTTKRCEACGASETPCWRPGYTAHSALCNSCGLRYKKSNVYCSKEGCKYIPLKTEYAAMDAERTNHGRNHLLCQKCRSPVALPTVNKE
ncbi:DNA-binding transcription repressor [Mortierella sp. AD031]|nr:DNA-binding transcription repressor [Mortierella sp. AD031]